MKRWVVGVVLWCVVIGTTAVYADRVVTVLDDWTCDGQKVSIPHTWNVVDGADGQGAFPLDRDNSVAGRGYERRSARYRTKLPPPNPSKRYFVRFGGAAINAKVAVNGRLVGEHFGPVTAFAYEITDYLRIRENVMDVVVDNYFSESTPPIYGDYTVFGGLYRPVELLETDQVCIDPTYYGGPGVEVETDSTGKVNVRTHINGVSDASVTYKIAGQIFQTNIFHVAGIKPWSPEDPQLYKLIINVKAGSSSDELSLNVGFRTAEFKSDGFYLNGVKRQMRGVNYHQEREGKGWAISEEDVREDLSIIRGMGADAIRGTHYPHSDFFYSECDRLGIMSWVEFPASSYVVTNELYVARLMDAVRETIAQHRNNPGVVVWGLFNELYSVWDGHKMAKGAGEFVVRKIQGLVKDVDRYHLTTCAAAYPDRVELNAVADVFGFNAYPGWYPAPGGSSADMKKTIDGFLGKNGREIAAIGEYGGGASIGDHENPFRHPQAGGRFHPEENQTDLHCVEYGIIQADPRVWGSFVWVMFDFASDNRDEGDMRGINDKGLVTRDRRTKKDAYWFYRANWTKKPVLWLTGKRMVRTPSERVTVRGFSNTGDVTLYVNGHIVGTQHPDAVKTVTWTDVKLERGRNVIELRSDELMDKCDWISTGECSRLEVKDK